MTLEQQYQIWLTILAAKQSIEPGFPDIQWYIDTYQDKKVEEIKRYGRTVPSFRKWAEIYTSPQNKHNENLT